MSLFVLPGLCLSTHEPPPVRLRGGGEGGIWVHSGMGFLGCVGECDGGGRRGRVMLGGRCCWTARWVRVVLMND